MQRVITVVLVMVFGITLAAQRHPDDEFLDWAARHAVRLPAFDVNAPTRWRSLKPIIGSARLVALGESTHGVREFALFRNRLFEFLVREQGFTAIAVETDAAEALAADEYVRGGDIDVAAATRSVFYNARDPRAENLELLQWMRDSNKTAPPVKRLRFYGIDVTGQVNGQFSEGRHAVDIALEYLDRADNRSGREFTDRFDSLLPRFNERDYPALADRDRDALTAALVDLEGFLVRRRLDLVPKTSAGEFDAALHRVVAARQLDVHLRARPRAAAEQDFRDGYMARDIAMFANVRAAFTRERDRGGLFVFAANAHVQRSGPRSPQPPFFPVRPPRGMGEYLHDAFGPEMLVLGSAFGDAESPLQLAPAVTGTVDATLAKIGGGLFVLDCRAGHTSTPAAAWLGTWRSSRSGDQTSEIVPAAAYDAFVFVPRVSVVKRLSR